MSAECCRKFQSITRGPWANAWTEVLRKISVADTDEDKDRALLWLSFLSQGLLRKPTRGGRPGRQQVAYRLNILVAGDCGALVELWLRDKEKTVADRTRRGRQRRDELVESERERKQLEVNRGEKYCASFSLEWCLKQ